MKGTTALAKLLTDEDLAANVKRLVDSIPSDQALLDAFQREIRRRKRREAEAAKSSAKLWTSDRPEFVERVAALAGSTTYRVPTAGKGTKMEQLPGAHAVATALAFGRKGAKDIGPDVAYCWALENDAYRHKVVQALAVALQCHDFRKVTGYRLQAAEAAWDAMVWNRSSSRPANAPPEYDTMLLTAVGTLQQSAWDALAEAEKRMYRKTA